MTTRTPADTPVAVPDGVTSKQPQRLDSAEVDTQQRLINKYKARYYSIVPSSYAPVVVDARGTTYRFFVRKSEWGASTMLEVRVRKGERV